MYGNVTKEHVEKVVNEIMQEREITVEYFCGGRVVKVSSPNMVLTGSSEVFDKAMIAVVNNKHKQD